MQLTKTLYSLWRTRKGIYETGSMDMSTLAQLTVAELERVKRRNLQLFNVLMILNLAGFYRSLHAENWLMLFINFGVFIVGSSLYDNYQVSKRQIERCLQENHRT